MSLCIGLDSTCPADLFRCCMVDQLSSSVVILCSVPQGSVLGSRLFILHTADLTDVANEHRVTIHMFTDDTQLYVHCGRDNTALTIVRLQHCIMDINHWMSANRLKLNMDKTELIWTGTQGRLRRPGAGGAG